MVEAMNFPLWLQGILFTGAAGVAWVIVFLVAFFFTRMGANERDDENNAEIEAERKAAEETGWKPLTT